MTIRHIHRVKTNEMAIFLIRNTILITEMLERAIVYIFKGRLKAKEFQYKSVDQRCLELAFKTMQCFEHESKSGFMKINSDGHYKPRALEKNCY